jgi:RNA-directed DNA polymerase
MDHQADEAWVLGVQRKLYQWSKANPEDAWRDMWGWITDLRVLRHAWRRVASNRGGRTAGIDGVTVGRIRNGIGEQCFLEGLQAELHSGAYRPSPARRKLIPKAGKPGQFRPLGIPTIKDRVVQGAVKTLLEPIFEAQFWHVSYGFRPGRSTHGALEYIRRAALPHKRDKDTRRNRMPYPWVIEGDIKGCFDNLSHHHLLERLRQRVADRRVTRLIGQFLKAGVLSEEQFLRTDAGTPQGGILSPLLANIALSAIEERYERWVYQRTKAHADRRCDGRTAAGRARYWDRMAGRCAFLPVRYADDVRHITWRWIPFAERRGLEEMTLGPTAYLTVKAKGDSSMPSKRTWSEDAYGHGLQGPRDMVRAGLPEPQSPAMQAYIPRHSV